MSELKAYIAPTPDGTGLAEYYLKSEADKVIAELKNEIETQKRLRDMALASVPNALKVAKIIQHNKYKRCLAMADMNWWQANRYSAAEMVERIRGNFEEATQCSKLEEKYLKRYNKWLALAEEPTWAKFLQLIRKEAK